MLYRVYGGTVSHLWRNLAPYIEVRQQHNPRLYINFTRLAIRWQNRRVKEKSHITELEHLMPDVHRMANELDLLVEQKNQLVKIENRSHQQSDELYQKQVQIDEQIKALKQQLAQIESHVS